MCARHQHWWAKFFYFSESYFIGFLMLCWRFLVLLHSGNYILKKRHVLSVFYPKNVSTFEDC